MWAVVAVIVWYNYLCNQSITIRARCTTLCDKVCQWLATCLWFSPGPSTNTTARHDITEILRKAPPNKQTNKQTYTYVELTVF
jgi:hypothetical protein